MPLERLGTGESPAAARLDAEGASCRGQDVLASISETTDQVDRDLIVMSTHALTGAARAAGDRGALARTRGPSAGLTCPASPYRRSRLIRNPQAAMMTMKGPVS